MMKVKFNLCVRNSDDVTSGPTPATFFFALARKCGKIVAQFNRSKPTLSIREVAAEGSSSKPWIGTQGHFFVSPQKKKKDFLSFSFRASLRRAPSVTQVRESLEFHCQIQLPFSSNCQRRLGFLFSRWRRNRSNREHFFN